jgi:AcrR family transcriptional regulator
MSPWGGAAIASRPVAADPGRKPARRRRAHTRDNEAGHETRERLLNAGEHLFAERGLDAVSVRDITEAAGANTAAVHYHFGSKRDLIAAILQRRASELGHRRDELLDVLQGDDEVDLRQVVDALVRPTAELAQDLDGGQHYVAFLAALGGNPDLMHLVIGAYDPYTERFLDVLTRATPSLPDDVRMLRFAVGKDLINRVLGQPRGQIHEWVQQWSPGADTDIVTRLIDILVGMFEGPVTAPRPGRPRLGSV